MTEAESTSKMAKHKQPQPQAKQNQQQAAHGNQPKKHQPQSQPQAKQNQQHAANGNQPKKHQPQSQPQAKQNQQHAANGNQPKKHQSQSQPQAKQNQQQAANGNQPKKHQPQSQPQAKQNQQQAANGNQPKKKHKPHSQQQKAKGNQPKTQRQGANSADKVLTPAQQRKIAQNEAKLRKLAALREKNRPYYEKLMERLDEDMKIFKGVESRYKWLFCDVFEQTVWFNDHGGGRYGNYHDPSEKSGFEVLSCIGSVSQTMDFAEFGEFPMSEPIYYGLFIPYIKHGEEVSVELLKSVLKDTKREAFIEKHVYPYEDEKVYIRDYYLFLNTDTLSSEAAKLLKQLKSRDVHVFTLYKMLSMDFDWKKHCESFISESDHYRKRSKETGCDDLSETWWY